MMTMDTLWGSGHLNDRTLTEINVGAKRCAVRVLSVC